MTSYAVRGLQTLVSACLLHLAVGGSALAADPPAASDPMPPARPELWELPGADLFGIDAVGDAVWAVGYWGTVLRSSDGGGSWLQAPTPTRETLYAVSFADARHGWAVGAIGTLLRSVDGGATWEAQTARIRDEFGEERPLDVHLFGVSAISPSEAWAVGDLGVVLHTRDGREWEQVVIPAESFGDDDFPDRIFNAVDFVDAQHGWIAGEFGTTLRTRDGGQTWVGARELVDTHTDVYLYALSALDAERAAVSGLAGTVLVSDDGGATWQPRRTGTSAGIFGVARSPSALWAVGDRGVMFTQRNGQSRWIDPERPRLFNWLTAVDYADETRVFAVGEKGLILRSQDGGLSWEQVAGEPPPPMAGISVPPEPGTVVEPGARPPQTPRERQPTP